MVTSVSIAGRVIGPGHPCFVIAEAGVNHNGSLDLARQLVHVAVAAGADAVKFQTFTAERLATYHAPKADYQRELLRETESQLEMLRRVELSLQAHRELMAYSRELGIMFLSSPFEEESADRLEALGVPAFKVPSGEMTNLPFLEHVARKGKPMLVSTGMATLEEVKDAVRTVRAAGNSDLILLHCVSTYPARPTDVNLRALQTLANTFTVPVGYSDHTLGTEVAIAAVALGACVIEKHVTLDRSLPGPDHKSSLEPDELRHLVDGIRNVEAALGHGRKEPAERENAIGAVARRSLVAATDILAGTLVTRECIAIKRPGTGLSPSMLGQVIGRRAVENIPADTVITLAMLT